jgi:glycosyltransferase involved in cell wall biosynthesis
MIALLGCKDAPVDGVEDYCSFLGRALASRGVEMKQSRVDWKEEGWFRALRTLWRQSIRWRGKRVVLQYTALGWSSRGFPFGALVALTVLRRRGARCAVVFHESQRQGQGSRIVDRVRGAVQDAVIRRLYRAADSSIFTIPLAKVTWLEAGNGKASFVPIGANVPARLQAAENTQRRSRAMKKVAVFCFSAGANRFLELEDISRAMRSLNGLASETQLIVLGKGSEEMRTEIRRSLQGCPVDVSVLGSLPAPEVSEVLAGADVLLFVSGRVSQTRGSALAGVACGLPIVGYAGSAAGTPMEEAGVALVPYRNPDALGAALARVLTDDTYREELRRRSRCAQQKYFSWDTIASLYVNFLELCESESTELDHHSDNAERICAQASR